MNWDQKVPYCHQENHYGDSLIAEVKDFKMLRAALDEAEKSMYRLAEAVGADKSTITTSVDFCDCDPVERKRYVRLRWEMVSRKSPEDILQEKLQSRCGF